MTQPSQPASHVNPEAGDHSITADPAALAACASAIGRTYDDFPYYEERYGARGRAFSASDSGWLMTVADRDPQDATAEVFWLGRVLAARGMPRLLLDRHLRYLAEELRALAEESPEYGRRADRLSGAAAALEDRRVALVAPQDAAPVIAAFDAAAPPEEAARLPRTGELVVAAVADERDGLSGAVASLVDWLTDSDRFSPAWIATVQDTLRAARALPGESPRGGPLAGE